MQNPMHHRYQDVSSPQHPMALGLLPCLPLTLWLALTGLLAVIVAVGLFLFPAYPHPDSSQNQFLQWALKWQSIQVNAPLSHYPLATAVGYVLSPLLGILSGVALILLNTPLSRIQLNRFWRKDLLMGSLLFSLLGATLLASLYGTIPWFSGHLFSVAYHTGAVYDFLMDSLTSRSHLVSVGLALYALGLLSTSAFVGGFLMHRLDQKLGG